MFKRDRYNDELAGPGLIGLPEGVGHQHIMAAMAAIVASMTMHAVLLYLLSGMDLGLMQVLRNPEARVHRTVQLRDVRIDEPVLAAPGEGAADANGRMLPDLAKDIDILRRPPDAVALQPRAGDPVPLTGEGANIAAHSPLPERVAWQPRQEIIAIQREIATDEVPTLERTRIPRIERVSRAADVVPPMQWDDVLNSAAKAGTGQTVSAGPVPAEIVGGEAARTAEAGEGGVVISEKTAEQGAELFEEKAGEVTTFKSVDKLLTAQLSTFSSRADPNYGYFRIAVKRLGADVLPVIPKDIVLVQDCSASMAEQQLYFCREGLRRCLTKIGPDDRFNVIGFREQGERCFPDWRQNNIENIVRAEQFIDGMRSGGNTDIYASLQEVLDLARQPGRPLVVLVITDGLSTTGLTRSSDIIGEFSKRNDGRVSVFAVGTTQRANKYLLDLISYCNRGGSQVVESGRWDIPVALEELMTEVGRPVLADVGFRFTADSGCEAYPVLTENMYLDRSLVVYGRYPHQGGNITFQAVGQASQTVCDMVFNLQPDRDGVPSEMDLRTEWARQKVYHLIGQYARGSDPQIMREIRETAGTYKVKIPYSGEF